MKIAEYVLANGVDKDIKAPNSHTLGYDVDILMTKALRQKSDAAFDKQEHSFHVISNSKSKGRIDAIILSRVSVTERNGRKYVDGLDVKISPSGELVILMHATGFIGDVKQTKMNIRSKETKDLYIAELDYQLTHMDFQSLRK